ncbi:MAG: class I SAM-dependent methyltransferase [Roseobacter sp.]
MTLTDHLIKRIESNGPISIADYMADCLLHPTLGYYTTRAPFGAKGDFITAPEISQMFGELIGLCLAQTWIDQGQPARFSLAELGPGRGTLMADALRAAGKVPGFLDAAEIFLVEASDQLRTIQQTTLAGHTTYFLNHTTELPDQPLFVVANEFFDALPIRQFVKAKSGWHERQIGVEAGALVLGLGPDLPQPALSHRLADTQAGDVVEYAPSAGPIIHDISTRIKHNGGAALIIDYGDCRSLGDTLQAVQNHETIEMLQAPGASDLTAHVDFEALATAATTPYTRLTPQGVFLERLGITARAQALALKLAGAAQEQHITAHQRLTHPAEMGNLFKVLGLFPDGATPPPGLDI